MARRKTRNHTGIAHRPEIDSSALWIVYTCVNCSMLNAENIGKKMITPEDAYKKCEWICKDKKCKFKHSRKSDLPENWTNWDSELRKASSPACQKFWKSFFKIATEKPEYYWKQCKTCGLTLPYKAFSYHGTHGGILKKQFECKACKDAINTKLNPKRTTEQHREGSLNRRFGELLATTGKKQKEKLNVEELFERFDSKCFKTKKPLDIKETKTWHIDHILPVKYFYPLTKENACLLSDSANGDKNGKWPSKFYSSKELAELARITGADLTLLLSKKTIYNKDIDVNKATEKWIKSIRSTSDFSKKIDEYKEFLKKHNLTSQLSDNNKKILGIS